MIILTDAVKDIIPTDIPVFMADMIWKDEDMKVMNHTEISCLAETRDTGNLTTEDLILEMKDAVMVKAFTEIFTETENMIKDVICKLINTDPDMVSPKNSHFFAVKESKNFFHILKCLKNFVKFVNFTYKNTAGEFSSVAVFFIFQKS